MRHCLTNHNTMSDLINLNENGLCHAKFREDGGLFIAKFTTERLLSVSLSAEELQVLTNLLSTNK